MYIANIEISNFRIYYGSNSIPLRTDPRRNISLVCGENGRGKTTLLTAIVWCLYGRQIQDVDKSYRERVVSAGGYSGYLRSSINTRSLSEGVREFSVVLDLADVELPGVQSHSLQISRSYGTGQGDDRLEIRIDGKNSELINDVGQQMFIQDFIMPKDLAKFFFFDAERITALAEIHSAQEKKLLSGAYSEVLGIRKYEDLRNNLKDLRIRFRKDSASELELNAFETSGKEIAHLTKSIDNLQRKRETLLDEKSDLMAQSDAVQENLLRQGGGRLTMDEVKELRVARDRLLEETKRLKSNLRDMFDLAPFAVSGKLLQLVKSQLDSEHSHRKSVLVRQLLEERIEQVVRELKSDSDFVLSENGSKEKFVSRIRSLLVKHLIEEEPRYQAATKALHDFSDEQMNAFDSLYSNLSSSYKERFQELVRSMRVNASDYSRVSSRLMNAESIQADPLVKSYRDQKQEIELRMQSIDAETMDISSRLGALESALKSAREGYEQLAGKIKVSEQFVAKDQLATRLISELELFLNRIKVEKKESLERRLHANLRELMHKKEFVHDVTIQIGPDSLDVHLLDGKGNEIQKDSLSRGEQQLYATALLLSLVEEAKTKFPIFVDSPLQKFDDKHSRNIIAGFYPRISKQVIILPLLNKELSADEYRLMADHTRAIRVIDQGGFS